MLAAQNSSSKKRLVKRFVLKAIAFYFLWQIVFHFFIKPSGSIDRFLTGSVITGTAAGLNILGFSISYDGNIISIDQTPVLRVENECNGLELIALFIGFLVCFPGKISKKIPYIILGSILIYMINIVRVMLLGLNYYYSESTFEINHKYTYTIVVYFLIFLIWKHWIKNYSAVSKRNVDQIET